MQKTKKQLLGIAGLAAVGVMTAIAYTMPSPASAYEQGVNDAPATSAGNVDLNVTVLDGMNQVTIKTPANGSATTKESVPVLYSYENASRIETYLQYTNNDGTKANVLIDNFTPTEVYGERSFTIDLSKYGLNDRQYTLLVRSYDGYGTPKDDTVNFSYRAIVVTPIEPGDPTDPTDPGNGSDNGDPVIDVEVSDDVDEIYVHIRDKDGKPAIVDKDGNEVIFKFTKDDIDPETGELRVKLPFEEYGLEDGEYSIVIVGKDKDGNDITVVTTTIDYTFVDNTKTPDTPNTGSVLDNLNITRVDYIITGIIVFGLVAGAALFLVSRKSRR